MLLCSQPSSPNSCGVHYNLSQLPRTRCGTCEGRCGLTNTLSRNNYCSCDTACVVYNDCCWNVQSACPEVFMNASSLRATFTTLPLTLCLKIPSNGDYFLFVQQCSATRTMCPYSISEKSLDLNYGVPVRDIEDGIYYVNAKCALCNGANHLELARVDVECDFEDNSTIHDTGYDGNRTITMEDLLHAVETSAECHLKYVFPKPSPRICVPVVDFCPAYCDNEELSYLCTTESQSYMTVLPSDEDDEHNVTYRNEFCALCNLNTLNITHCGFYIAAPMTPPWETIPGFSLSLLLDFNPEHGPSVGYITVVCDNDQVVLPSGIGCGDVVCPRGYTLKDGVCVDESDTGWIIVHSAFHLRLVGQISICNSSVIMGCISSEILGGLVNATLAVHLDAGTGPNVSCAYVCRYDMTELVVYRVMIHYHGYNTNLVEYWQRTGLKVISCAILSLENAMNISFTNHELEVADIGVIWTPDDINTTCAGISLPITDFEITNGSYILKATGDRYTENDVIVQHTNIILCSNESDLGGSYVLFSTSTGLGITTIVLSLISLLCLCCRLVLQCKSKHFHTLAGRMQCHLAVALALATCLLLVSPLTIECPLACGILGALKYYAYVACFLWMACIAGDTWRAFRPLNVRANDNPTRALTKYTCASWLTPLVMTGILYGLDYTDIPERYKPQMGGYACWFSERFTLMIYFLPVVCAFALVNIILFLMTVRELRIAFQNSVAVQKTAEKKCEFLIYVKLFLLMGLTWTVGFVAGWVNIEPVWYIFVVLNSSQGIYLFLAFVIDLHAIVKAMRQSCISSGMNALSKSHSSSGKARVTLDTRL